MKRSTSAKLSLARLSTMAAAMMGVGGCAALPSSGPAAYQIVEAQERLRQFDLVNVDEAVVASLEQSRGTEQGRLAELALPGDVDAIGPGDVLQISVYEVGVSLFGGRRAMADALSPASGSGEMLSAVTVGRDGLITLPWVGEVSAAGKTSGQLAAEITQAYRHSSENPQVMVTLRENVNNTVIVQGDVKKPGRFPLSLARERLLDAIAIAGGTSDASSESMVRLHRGEASAEQPFSTIDPGSPDDVMLLPQDRISVALRTRTLTVLGASGRAMEIPFQASRVSLAETIGRAGGLSDAQADPSAVFVFRYSPSMFDGAPVEGARPVAYRLNLREPQGYFLAQRFEMHPRDVIYIANARAHIPTKAIQILNLFFSPFYTARVLTQ